MGRVGLDERSEMQARVQRWLMQIIGLVVLRPAHGPGTVPILPSAQQKESWFCSGVLEPCGIEPSWF